MPKKDSNFQAKECIEREDDIPGDVLGALVKERISKKDCADHVSVITLWAKAVKWKGLVNVVWLVWQI